MTPHTDKLSLDADQPDTEGPTSLQLTSQIPPATQSPNLPPSLSLSIGQGLGVGVHIMAANRQSLDRANIGVISGQPATSTPTSTTTDHNAVGGESRLLTPANS